MTEEEPVAALTNFERLAKALPETGIARALLIAWTTGDPAGRVDRMLKVAQPLPVPEASNGSPES